MVKRDFSITVNVSKEYDERIKPVIAAPPPTPNTRKKRENSVLLFTYVNKNIRQKNALNDYNMS